MTRDNYTYIAFDTETTGFPRKTSNRTYASPVETAYYNSSRIISISFYSESLNVKDYSLIKPGDFPINNSDIHGITKEEALSKGISLEDYFYKNPTLIENIKKADVLIAHNAEFDKHILLSELYRRGMKDIYTLIESKPIVCTMKFSYRKYMFNKYPKLLELYSFLYKESFFGAHNALADSKACYDCYEKMLCL